MLFLLPKMSESVIIAIVGGFISIILLWMQNKQAVKLALLQTSQAETHKLINSRMTELLELTRKQSKAEGKLEGKAEEKSEKLKISKKNTK